MNSSFDSKGFGFDFNNILSIINENLAESLTIIYNYATVKNENLILSDRNIEYSDFIISYDYNF